MVYKNTFVRLLLLAALFANASISFAAMYKWVDKDGRTHYTQSPPPDGIESKNIKAPPKINPEHSRNQLKARQELLENNRKRRYEAAETVKKNKNNAKQRLAACEKAKTSLASYQRPRVNKVDSEGNRARISEEQRRANITKAQKMVAESCKK